MTWIFWMLLVSSASADEWLKPMPSWNFEQISFSEDVACSELANKFKAYEASVRKYDESILGYLGQIESTFRGWYVRLSALEGRQISVPDGYFSFLKDGAEKLSASAENIFAQSDVYFEDVDKLREKLIACSSNAALPDEVDQYNVRTRENESTVNTYLIDLAGLLEDWQDACATAEGQTGRLFDSGFFDPIATTAENVAEAQQLLRDNFVTFQQELAKLIQKIEEAVKVEPAA